MVRVSQAISSDFIFFTRTRLGTCGRENFPSSRREAFLFVCLLAPVLSYRLSVAGNARAIVTYNKKDLMRGQLVWPEMKILSPPECLEELA